MMHSSCLCGDVRWTIEGPLEFMHHCHCSRCRKTHGSAFTTYVGAPADGFRFASGTEQIRGWESTPGSFRDFCRRCGSAVPGKGSGGQVFLPVGCFEGDLGARPLAHIFVGSKAPWFEIKDALPQFAAFPPGVDFDALPDRPPLDPPGPPRGSCLCGGVTYVIEGEPLRCWNCHCSRCRKARSSAFASNLFTTADGLRFMRGEELLVSYKVPEAQHFTQRFCGICGSSMPRIDRGRDLGIVPMGTLDDDPGVRPSRHIFAASKAPWFDFSDDLPRDDESPSV